MDLPIPRDARPLAVFRADASAAIGGGHLVRCLVVANHLAARGWRCAFATSATGPQIVPALARSRHHVRTIGDGATALRECWPAGADLLVVDHYGLDADFEGACRPWASRIAVIDDLADRSHDADVLIDATLGREPAEYRTLVPPSCRLLLGPQFALLRPAFAQARAASLARGRDTLGKMFVGFGATDPDNQSAAFLRALARLPDVVIDIVLGSGAPHLATVAAMAAADERVHLHVDSDDVAHLMADADFAFGNAGTGAWERCALGLPSAVVAVADNQRAIARALAGVGAAFVGDAGTDSETVVRRVAGQNAEHRHAIATAAASICDGLGAMRVVGVLSPAEARDGRPVHLLPAAASDCQRVLEWQRAPGIRRHARNPNAPADAEHRAWFAARLADPRCIFSLIYYDHAPAGLLRLDRLEPARDVFEVSILVAPEFQGRAVAAAALAAARRLVPWAAFHAEVLPGNATSAALFARAGYRPCGPGQYIDLPQGDAA